MRTYREHLRVPASYWILGLITMLTFASFSWAGFNLIVGVAAYVLLVFVPAVALWVWGNATIEVSDGELRAEKSTLPLARSGHVQVLDVPQTTAMRGPLADPAAFMLIRPYISRVVYIEVTASADGEAPEHPYWLVGSRDPEGLAAAIVTERARAARAGDPSVA